MVLMLVLALPGLALAQDGPTVADLSLAMDTVWVIVAAVLVLFMQAGFAMLEVGFSRMKNVGSVVAKILVNLAIAALLFWAVGFALAFGSGNALLGTEGWFLAVPAGQVNEVYAGLSWWGCTPDSTMAAVPDIADIALTTNLAAAAGVLGAMGMSYLYRRNVDVGMGGNGAIAALVAITAPCAFVAPWASIVIGCVAGIIMYATLVYVDRIGVDDPLGAIAAHGMGGIWGTLSCGLFTTPALAAVGEPGLFYGGGLYQLGIQALGIVAAGGFVFLASLAVFATLKATIGIRVKPEQELDGLDIHEHGVFGYPDLVATDYQNGNGNGRSREPVTGATTEGTA